jgi:hypothetical protein
MVTGGVNPVGRQRVDFRNSSLKRCNVLRGSNLYLYMYKVSISANSEHLLGWGFTRESGSGVGLFSSFKKTLVKTFTMMQVLRSLAGAGWEEVCQCTARVDVIPVQ